MKKSNGNGNGNGNNKDILETPMFYGVYRNAIK